MYYLYLHPSGNIKVWRNPEDYEEDSRKVHARRGGYKINMYGLWTTQGRLLHPRPAIPTDLPNSRSDNKTTNSKNASKGSKKKTENKDPQNIKATDV